MTKKTIASGGGTTALRFLLLLGMWGQCQAEFEVSVLEVGIHDSPLISYVGPSFVYGRLSGSEGNEIVVLMGQKAMIFSMTSTGRYGPTPSRTIDLPPGTAVAVGQTGNSSAESLLMMGASGVKALSNTSGERLEEVSLVTADTIYAGNGETGSSEFWDFLRDVDGDGRGDLIVPYTGGLRVFSSSRDSRFTQDADFPLEHHRSASISVSDRPAYLSGVTPYLLNRPWPGKYRHFSIETFGSTDKIILADINRDQRLDIVSPGVYTFDSPSGQETLYGHRIFFQSPDGNFPAEPSQVFLDPQGEWTHLMALDINGDGDVDKFDVQAVRRDPLYPEFAYTFKLLINRGGDRYPSEAAQVIRTREHLSPDLPLLDFDSDGDLDLVLIESEKKPLTPGEAASKIVDSGFSMKIKVYPFEETRFASKPICTKEFWYTPLRKDSWTMRGDFNADGYRDLIFFNPTSILAYYYDSRGRRFRWFSRLENPIARPGIIRIADLNGDGRSDVLFDSPGTDQLLVLVSR